MNPWDLDATGLMVWGLVAHLIADWPLQNDWMARNKSNPLHLAAPVHASVHAILLAVVFGWPGVVLGAAHFFIDLRTPVVWWSRLVRQTQPSGTEGVTWYDPHPVLLYDVGLEVRFWTDQVFHIACIAVAALVIA